MGVVEHRTTARERCERVEADPVRAVRRSTDVGVLMSISRRELLASAAAIPLVGLAPVRVGAAPTPQPRRLVLVVLSGGWDSAYCLDPKLNVPGFDPPSLDSDPNDPTDVEQVESFSGLPIAINE